MLSNIIIGGTIDVIKEIIDGVGLFCHFFIEVMFRL